MPCSPGKPWVPAFTWTPLWEATLTQTPLQTKCGRSWQWHCSMAVSLSRTMQLHHCKNCSVTTKGACQRAQSVNLGSKFPRSQSSWESIGCTMSQEQSMGAPTWMGMALAHPTDTQLTGIWWIQRPVQCLEFFVRFIRPSLSRFCCVAGALSCRGATTIEECCCHEGVYLVCNDVWDYTRQRGVHINARTQGFPAQHLIVTRWSMLTSPVSVSMFWLMVYIHVKYFI